MKEFYNIADNGIQVYSADGTVVFNLEICDGMPYYSVEYDNNVFFDKSLLGLKVNGRDFTKNVELKSVKTAAVTDEFSIYGRVSTVREQYVNADISLLSGGYEFILQVRVYSDGVAFRYIFEKSAGKTVNAEYTSFKIDENSYVYASFGCRHELCQTADYLANYEAICYEATYDRFLVKDIFYPTKMQDEFNHVMQNAENAQEYILTPMAIEFPKSVYKKQYYGAILEGRLKDYVGINLRQRGKGKFELNTTYQVNRQFVDFDVTGDCVVTPYRILTIAKNLSDLYNNTIVYSVNDSADDDYSWVKPGRSAWSWRSEGQKAPTPELMHKYSIAAAKLGFEYNTVDGGWPKSLKTENAEAIETLRDLCTAYEKYGVGQIVWEGFTASKAFGEKAAEKTDGVRIYTPDYEKIEAFIKVASEAGAKGLKLDFMPPEDQVDSGINIYERVARLAAKYKMIIEYHGATKPTGLNRKLLNILNYEGIYGHEMPNANESFEVEAQLFTTQYLTRSLAGHADYTPHTLNGLGLAELVFVDAPLNVIDAKPDEMLNSHAVEFIKACPTVWDETRVLSVSEFGRFGAIARNSGGNWFLGVINNGKSVNKNICLGEFLDKDSRYFLEIYTDNGVIKQIITGDYVIENKIEAYSGFAARISKARLSSYGGEYKAPVEMTFSEDRMYAFFTTDETNPITSPSAKRYTKPIELSKSCRVNFAVFKGDKVINTMSYRFNIME